MQVSRRRAHTVKTVKPLHRPTKAKDTGLGTAVAAGFKLKPGKGPIWNSSTSASLLHAHSFSLASLRNDVSVPHPRVELERWVEVCRLRAKLKALCRQAGLAASPILAFERWLARAKMLEAITRSKGPAPNSKAKKNKKKHAAKENRQARAVGGGQGPSHEEDPVIPHVSLPERGLVNDLVRGGLAPAAAKVIAQQLATLGRQACETVRKCQISCGSGAADAGAGAGAGATSAWQVQVAVHRHTMDVTLKGPTKVPRHMFKLNPCHWDKLVGLYSHGSLHKPNVAASDDSEALADSKGSGGERKWADPSDCSPASRRFRTAVFCVLARYHAIQGPGFQAAVVEHAFQVLHGMMGVGFECFASPLNCHFARFCSAFPDVDAPFGSVGSCFSFFPLRGSFEVNPPFIDSVMLSVARHLQRLLGAASSGQLTKEQRQLVASGVTEYTTQGDEAKSNTTEGGSKKKNKPRALSFVVVVPGWTEDEGWKLLESSPFTRAHWLVARKDHGFCDGAQHQRRDRCVA